MSFYTALSGLQASQTDMATISHNLANVATTGFKKSRTEFADVIASSVSTDPRKMVGSGVVVKGNTQQFKEGNLQTTSNALDLALVGEGFFIMKSTGTSDSVNYTRNGSFSVDSGNNVVDAQGSYLMVYPVDSDGNVTATGNDGLTNLQIQQTSGTPKATGVVSYPVQVSSTSTLKGDKIGYKFDRSDTATYNNSVATRVYDANGNPQTMTSYYVRTKEGTAADPNAVPAKDATTGTWDVYTFIGDQPMTTGTAKADKVTLTFDDKGALADPKAAITFNAFVPTSGAASQTVSLNLSGSTQLSSAFSVGTKKQDGIAVGQLAGVTVTDSGLIRASFSNGDIVPLGKVALAKFSTPTGLRQIGTAYWEATGVSGEAALGSASADGFGKLMSGTIEGSNVDITEELVNLIAAQRNFQANAKALDTASQVSQTIFNIRS
ncbi:flagellar hook protein FlgE [Sphingomonas sp. Leaf343]|uniref:flagellar hook protein FlgE n=1 Tax=Sphingomonas sp. Leaf343 TaxID=1736345 RepID=UPI0006FE6D45|nr:flagellar hook protein FlgE [Sphingomonas sp. Leaf343]KQR82219.1 flagellar hook-basal body protein [Sphingomonas sp. Leaf343]